MYTGTWHPLLADNFAGSAAKVKASTWPWAWVLENMAFSHLTFCRLTKIFVRAECLYVELGADHR